MRKTLLIIHAGCIAACAAQAQEAGPAAAASTTTATRCVEIEVQNVRPLQGQLMLAAYGDAESYGKQAMSAVRAPAGEATTRLQMCGIRGDTLAISLFQDLDGDGKMAKNLLGLPLEPWGSSGKPGPFGPSWETGKVTLDGSPIVVKLSL